MQTRRINWIFSALSLTVLATGCASLQSVSMTQVPSNRDRPIEATASNWAFLGIHFSNDFVDEAIEELRNKCPQGKITGVYTKYENYLYFLVSRRVVRTTAYCESPKTAKL